MISILKNNRPPMPEIKRGPIRCLTGSETADALPCVFQGHFTHNDRDDPDQEKEFRSVLHEISEIDTSLPFVVSPKEVLQVIRGLPNRKAPGERHFQ